eukprot:gene2483-2824_t
MLNDLGDDLSILGVVGTFHSGKSFLLNQLMGSTDRFTVGPTVHPQTLDTEGFYSSNVSETYDDQSALEYLELLSRRTQLFALKSHLKIDSPLTKILQFPSLTWVVQDFFQDIGDITATEWLEGLLKAHSRDQPDSSLSLPKIFPSIKCHTLFIPSGDRTTLRHLDRAKVDDLSPIYRKEVEDLKNTLFQSIKTKLPGPAIGSLIKLLVEVANGNNFPTVPSIWAGFLKQQQLSAMEDSVTDYKDKMSVFKSIEPPLSEANFTQLDQTSRLHAQDLYKQLLFGLEEAYTPGLAPLVNTIKELGETFRKDNQYLIRQFCNSESKMVFISFQEEIGAIKTPTGTQRLQKLIDSHRVAALGEFKTKTDAYASTDAQRHFQQTLTDDIERISTSKLLQNKNELETLLSKSVIIAGDKYKNLMKSELDNQHKRSKETAVDVFRSSVEMAKDEVLFGPFLANLEVLLAQHYDGFKRHNEEKIKEQARIESKKAVHSFKLASSQILLPVEDEYLEPHLVEYKSKSLEEYKRNLSLFQQSAAFTEELTALTTMIDKQIEIKLKENVEQMKLIVMEDLSMAKMLMKARLSSFWFQYSFVDSFKEEAEKRIGSKISSKRLRDKVIQNYIADSLKEEVGSLFHMSTLIGTVIIVILLAIIFSKTHI